MVVPEVRGEKGEKRDGKKNPGKGNDAEKGQDLSQLRVPAVASPVLLTVLFPVGGLGVLISMRFGGMLPSPGRIVRMDLSVLRLVFDAVLGGGPGLAGLDVDFSRMGIRRGLFVGGKGRDCRDYY